MPHTVKRRGTMETYRNEEQMQCLAKSEGCKYASGQPVSGRHAADSFYCKGS